MNYLSGKHRLKYRMDRVVLWRYSGPVRVKIEAAPLGNTNRRLRRLNARVARIRRRQVHRDFVNALTNAAFKLVPGKQP